MVRSEIMPGKIQKFERKSGSFGSEPENSGEFQIAGCGSYF
jgi:hypothetical protein